MTVRPLAEIKTLTQLHQQQQLQPQVQPQPQAQPHPLPLQDIKPRITVMGAGGAGSNAVNNMIRSKLEGVDFVVCNTDAQALSLSLTENRIQLGMTITQGLGAGSKPEIGQAAAEETLEEILHFIHGTNMLFITAGMGGGTGTGAAPVIAKTAREMGILTVGVVTKPFHFEGAHRLATAERGIEELQQYVDTLIVIPNQNLFRVANEKTTFADAFKMADEVLYSGVRSVTDLMIIPGLINLDFADIRTVMSEMGKAMMGTGEAGGDNRAIQAAEAAIANPLLDEVSMKGAKGVLISVTGGMDMTLFEVDEAANRIRDEVEVDANIIFGSTFDERLNGKIRVSVVATGIDQANVPHSVPMSAPVSQPVQESSSETIDNATAATYESYNDLDNLDNLSGQTDLYSEPRYISRTDQSENGYSSLKMDLDEDMSIHHVPATEPARKPSFLERLTGSLTNRLAPQAPVAPQQTQRMRVRPTEPGSSFSPETDEDISEIPAYLRRQGK